MHKSAFISIAAALISGCVLQLPPQQQDVKNGQQQSPSPTLDTQQPKPEPKPSPSSSEWIDFGTSQGMTYQAKKGSFRFASGDKGGTLAVALGRILDANSGNVTAGQWYVTIDDCAQQMGSLVMTDTSGAAQWKVDFMFDAGNIASEIAETICGVAYQKAIELKEKEQKRAPSKAKGSAI